MKWFVFLFLLCAMFWFLLGAIAYFHRIIIDRKVYGWHRPFCLWDGFFYDSLRYGYIAFWLEFI